MPIVGAFAVPHPPLIIPAVGRGEERRIDSTVRAFERVAQQVVAQMPEVIVVSSPHAPAYRDGFYVCAGPSERGSMAQFGAPFERVDVAHDQDLAHVVQRLAGERGVPLAFGGYEDGQMDHGTFIPLRFVDRELERMGFGAGNYLLLRVGLSGLGYEEHRAFGQVIADAVDELGRRAVFVASGDLSHKLLESGPYGFAAEGPQFDERVCGVFDGGRLDDLFGADFSPSFCDAAAECGHRSFLIMAGALGSRWQNELLSYEGPFGVGYAVARFELAKDAAAVGETAADSAAGEAAGAAGTASGGAAAGDAAPAPDPFVTLARASVEHFVRTGQPLPFPEGLPAELTERRAGAFVSLHTDDLRGCIGTIQPTKDSLAEEIISNGVSACSQDPRFPAVREEELDFISYSVDVLGDAEPIDGIEQLDPQRYGVIVTSGWRRGLLLPALEGVDTAELQVGIARRKAGIGPNEPIQLERFEVVRHSAGGEARRG